MNFGIYSVLWLVGRFARVVILRMANREIALVLSLQRS